MNEVYKNSGPYLKILNFHEKFPDSLFIVYTSTAWIYYIPHSYPLLVKFRYSL